MPDGTQKIEDTGPLTKKRMETIDDDIAARAAEFIEKQAKAGKPMFVWVNFTHMHFRTHTKPESVGQSGRWQSPYHDTMIDHDKNVGTVLDKIDRTGHRRQHHRHVQHRQRSAHELLAGRGHDAVPQREELQLGRRLPRAGHGALAGQIKPGTVSNDIVSHLDWAPTLLAAAGVPDIKEKLLKGYKVGKKTYKVHLDGYNLLPYLTGAEKKSPRKEFFYFSDDGDLTALRYDNWKVVFAEQRAPGTLRVWAEPFTPLRVPLIFNLRTDPYERAHITSNTYYDWLLDHAFMLVPAQAYVGKFLATFKEFPPRQKAASFTIDQVMETLATGRAEADLRLNCRPRRCAAGKRGNDRASRKEPHNENHDNRPRSDARRPTRMSPTSPSRVPGWLSGSRRDDLLPGCPSAAADGKKTFTILHTNDMHSSFIGMGPAADYTPFTLNDDATRGGYARLAALDREAEGGAQGSGSGAGA